MEQQRKIQAAQNDMPKPYEGNEHLYHNRAEYAARFQNWARFNDEAIRAAMENIRNVTYKERILEDEYPIYPGYLYIVNGKVTAANYALKAPTVAAWKIALQQVENLTEEPEIKNCDIVGRGLQNFAI